MTAEPTIYIVDDDEAIRDSLAMLLGAMGYRTATYRSAEHFLADDAVTSPGCVLADVRMPGMGGLEMQQRLAARAFPPPVIVITGHGDVRMAVQALKAGAVDFIEKPFDDHVLFAAVRDALNRDGRIQREREDAADLQARFAALTTREREVMDLVVAGQANKGVATTLGISPRTVEIHRARVMEKMRADSLSELVRISVRLAGEDGRAPA